MAEPSDLDKVDIHPAVQEKIRWFASDHLRPELAAIVDAFRELALTLAVDLGLTGPQLTIGLQHLIEAKDAAVRAAVSQLQNRAPVEDIG